MTGFLREQIIKVKNDMETIQKELNELKEKFSMYELRAIFNRMYVTLTNYCRHDCVNRNCKECRINKVTSIISAKLDELDKIKALELKFLKLFNEYAEYVLNDIEDDLKELEKEVLSDE